MELTKAIVTAMKEEWDIIVQRFWLKEVKKFQNITIYEWERDVQGEKEKIVLANAWIGKIQSAIATTHLFENYDIDKLVNVWIAGNLNSEWDIKVWDVFLPNTFIQHDIYLPFDWEHLDYAKKTIFLDYAVGENYDLNKFWLLLSWICVTWDQFIDDAEKAKMLRENFSWDVCEMEAFSILSVAREYGKLDKCVVIKAVSDGANSDAIEWHMSHLEFAMNNSVDVLELVL